MKKASVFSLLVMLVLMGCNKKTNTPPEQDTDVSHAQDVMFAQAFVADLANIVIQSNNGDVYMTTYSAFTGTNASGAVSINTNTNTGVTTVVFNNTVCADGVSRNGTITVNASPVASLSMPKYPGYTGTVNISGLVVKNYSVSTIGNFIVKNTTPSGFVPSQKPMTWQISGELSFKNTYTNQPNTDFTWKGTLTMLMANSTNTALNQSPTGNFNYYLPVYSTTMTAFPTPTNAIRVEFSGSANGKVKTSTDYTLTIRDGSPIVKDYNKTPNYILAFRHHPLVSGKADLMINGLPTRYIDLGAGDIDDAGLVTINSVTYRLDLKY
jgi:hypothetical protein